MFAINPFEVCSYTAARFFNADKRELISAIDVILIDEVSMLRPDVLDGINWAMEKNRCGDLTKKQVIFVGDLKQLPPPISDNTRIVLLESYKGELFSDAKVYKSLKVKNVELHEILRQSDPDFIDALNVVREGGESEYFHQFSSKKPSGIVLAPHNATADRYNAEGLRAINAKEYVFDAVVEGKGKPEDFNLPAQVRVKHGAKIMYLVNSREHPLINGTIGEFVVEGDKFFIVVKGQKYEVKPVTLRKQEYVIDGKKKVSLRSIGSITQYPIKLAYALSIHKAQGLTFDDVTIDLTRDCFSPGQLYVALSRVKTPEGLKIKK